MKGLLPSSDDIEGLSEFLENASESVHLVDGKGIILWANDTELNTLGYARDEYIGQPIANFHTTEAGIAEILQKLSHFETLKIHPAQLRARDAGAVEDARPDGRGANRVGAATGSEARDSEVEECAEGSWLHLCPRVP